MRHGTGMVGAVGVLLLGGLAQEARGGGQEGMTLDAARRVIAAAESRARGVNAPGGVVAVVDEGGHLVAAERLDGTFAAGATISIGKARTAVLFKKPTKVFEDLINKGRTAMTALPDALFTPLQGGMPIVVDGRIIGGVGVSGAASAQQDEELAMAGAAALASEAGGAPGEPAGGGTAGGGTAAGDPATGAPVAGDPAARTPGAGVRFFSNDAVRKSFAEGGVLVNDSGGVNYMVHTSRRDQPGQAEVHSRDTDIIYVLEGATTFVTGGAVVGARTTALGETRGASIEGGETRDLRPGDVVIVPAGTPHWFREVKGPVLYYTVKVRS